MKHTVWYYWKPKLKAFMTDDAHETSNYRVLGAMFANNSHVASLDKDKVPVVVQRHIILIFGKTWVHKRYLLKLFQFHQPLKSPNPPVVFFFFFTAGWDSSEDVWGLLQHKQTSHNRVNVSHCLSSLWLEYFTSFFLTDHTRPEPAWQKMARSPSIAPHDPWTLRRKTEVQSHGQTMAEIKRSRPEDNDELIQWVTFWVSVVHPEWAERFSSMTSQCRLQYFPGRFLSIGLYSVH